MTWDDVWDKFRAYEDIRDTPFIPSVQSVPYNYVFDEEKSVRWNREEAVRINEKYRTEFKEHYAPKEAAENDLIQSIIEYIQQELSLDERKAKLVYEFCYKERRDYSWEELLYFVKELLMVFNE